MKLAGAKASAVYSDGAPAITTKVNGKGKAIYCAFLPSLSYYKPAIPKRPVDRGATDDAMTHFLPTEFDPDVAALIALPGRGISRPVECSNPLVETTVIQSKKGVVIPLVNWTHKPVKGLHVKVAIDTPMRKVSLASGRPLKQSTVEGVRVYTFDLDVADALILR